MKNRDFFINAIKMINVDGGNNIPSVLYYDSNKKVYVGSSALAMAPERHLINEDFKVELGNIDYRARMSPKRMFLTAANESKSAAALSTDFLYALLDDANSWFADNDLSPSYSVLMAEPLSMQNESVSDEWLKNYRKNLESILKGRGFENIDFLPEPFAVFQYYRYGVKHPMVAGTTKTCALVVDFGGGTFDVCIIETTNKGDISQSGPNSRPLAASSHPYGGFYVNRAIAEELLFKYLQSSADKTRLKKGFGLYNEWRKGTQDLSTTAGDYVNFIDKLHNLIYKIENPKLALCKSITNWTLDANLTWQAPIQIPKNPFSPDADVLNVILSGNDLRDIFINRIWEHRLKPTIKQTLHRGKEELCGAPLSVVLLSGGSANIGWLRELIRRDFVSDLLRAEIIQLPDFQEVVSKGLAAECARRFYTEDEIGDFSSVTYNRLCLILDPDDNGSEIRPFKSRTDNLPNSDTPGVLLPSCAVSKRFF